MLVSRTYKIEQWTKWDSFIFEAIDHFIAEYSQEPNVLLASDHTYSQIKYVINIIPGSEKFVEYIDAKGVVTQAQKGDELDLNSLSYRDVILDFCIENLLDSGIFQLVRADNGEFDDDDNNDDNDIDDDPVFDPNYKRSKKLILAA